jgi:hypothetical protein
MSKAAAATTAAAALLTHPVQDLLVVLDLAWNDELGWGSAGRNDAAHELVKRAAMEHLHHAKEAQVLQHATQQQRVSACARTQTAVRNGRWRRVLAITFSERSTASFW